MGQIKASESQPSGQSVLDKSNWAYRTLKRYYPELAKKNCIKAVVFDGDGVLVDLPDTHYIALNCALEDVGLPIISKDDHASSYNGLPTKTKLKMLHIEDPRLVANICALKQAHTMRLAKDLCVHNSTLVDLCSELKLLGYKMAVASNAVRETVDLMIAGSGVLPFLEFSLCNQDISSPKPHPEIYSLACARLGLPPFQVLAVEDSLHGQRAALEAGTRLCVVKNSSEVTISRIFHSIMEHERYL